MGFAGTGDARDDERLDRVETPSTVTFVSHSIDGTMPSSASTPQSQHGAPAMEPEPSHHASLGGARRGRELRMVYPWLASDARAVIPRNREDETSSRTCS